jgi:hypothetical protein
MKGVPRKAATAPAPAGARRAAYLVPCAGTGRPVDDDAPWPSAEDRGRTARTLSIAGVGALVWTGLGVALPAHAVTWTCASVKTVSWGSGQVCKGSDGSWKLRNRDEATDGYCVAGKYYSEDSASWRQTSPRSRSATASGRRRS